jgi:enoyl-[acyl-carrier protein] reductase III
MNRFSTFVFSVPLCALYGNAFPAPSPPPALLSDNPSPMPDVNLSGHRALITGASRGIGRAVALRLASAGACIALNYLRRTSAAEAVADEIRAAGGTCVLVRGNVADPDHVPRVASETVEALGGIDIVVSNAATGVLRPALELTPKHLQVTMETNAFALLELAKACVPHMPAGGRILAMSSLGATRVIPEYAAIAASKAALESLVRQLGAELAPKGVTVNAIAAGVVDTDALEHFPSRDMIFEMTRQRSPAGRLVTVDEVADATLLLCSPLGRAITGQTITVDHGYSTIA